MRPRNSANRLNSGFNPFVWHQCAYHQHNKSIGGKSEFLPLCRARSEVTAIDAIRNKFGAPSSFVPLIEFRVRTHQTVTSKKAIFGFVRKGWPVAIFRNEN